MKLKNITMHGITLSKIDYSPSLSHETAAFSAVCECDGERGEVGNDGWGGQNMIGSQPLFQALKARAATLPPVPPMFEGDEPLAYSADLLVSEVLEAAIRQHEDAKMKKKGYSYVIRAEGSGRVLYVAGDAPTAAEIKKEYGPRADKAVVTAL